MPVAFLRTDRSKLNFLFKKYACLPAKDTDLVLVTIIVSKLHGSKLMLSMGALVFCSLMLLILVKKIEYFPFILLYLSKEFQAFYNCHQSESAHMRSFFNLT